jgi:hypothetical protein
LYHYNPRVIMTAMSWEVEYTDEFGEWFDGLGEEAQEDVALAVEKLEERGPALPRPLADTVEGSRHSNMKELRPLASGCSSPSIRAAWLSCSSAATRRVVGASFTRR